MLVFSNPMTISKTKSLKLWVEVIQLPHQYLCFFLTENLFWKNQLVATLLFDEIIYSAVIKSIFWLFNTIHCYVLMHYRTLLGWHDMPEP